MSQLPCIDKNTVIKFLKSIICLNTYIYQGVLCVPKKYNNESIFYIIQEYIGGWSQEHN